MTPAAPPLRRSSQAAQVLSVLAPLGTSGYATEDHIAEVMALPADSKRRSVFRARVLKHLVRLGAIVSMGRQHWRLTPEGAEMLRAMRSAEEAPAPADACAGAGPVAPETASERQIQPMAGTYNGTGLSDAAALRTGAFDFRAHPSRMGDWLVYRDGRRVHDPIPPASPNPTTLARKS